MGLNENQEGEGGQTGEQKLQLGGARLQHMASYRSTANAVFQAPSVSQSCKAANVKPEVVLRKQLIIGDCTEPSFQAGRHVKTTVKGRGFSSEHAANCKLRAAVGHVSDGSVESGSVQFVRTDLISPVTG